MNGIDFYIRLLQEFKASAYSSYADIFLLIMVMTITFGVIGKILYLESSRWLLSILWTWIKKFGTSAGEHLTYPGERGPLSRRSELIIDMFIHAVLLIGFAAFMISIGIILATAEIHSIKASFYGFGFIVVLMIVCRLNAIAIKKAYDEFKIL